VLLCAAALALTALVSPAAYGHNTLSSGAAVKGLTLVKGTEPSAAGSSAFPGRTTIRSRANGLYVSMELGHPGDRFGMLRARAHGVGPWEEYDVIASGDAWSIRSRANARYVSAELGYTGNNYGMLRARATAVGPWEKYDLHRQPSGAYALRSQANGRYVSAELGYPGDNSGMLRARATAIGPWEQFYLN